GYYAMAGQGFDPDFIVSWPTGRMGVMEGESAIQAVFGNDAAKPENAPAVELMLVVRTPDSPPRAALWTRSCCPRRPAIRSRFSSRRLTNSPAPTSGRSCCRVNHEIVPHPVAA